MSMLSQNVSKGTKDIMIMMAGEEQAALPDEERASPEEGRGSRNETVVSYDSIARRSDGDSCIASCDEFLERVCKAEK